MNTFKEYLEQVTKENDLNILEESIKLLQKVKKTAPPILEWYRKNINKKAKIFQIGLAVNVGLVAKIDIGSGNLEDDYIDWTSPEKTQLIKDFTKSISKGNISARRDQGNIIQISIK